MAFLLAENCKDSSIKPQNMKVVPVVFGGAFIGLGVVALYFAIRKRPEEYSNNYDEFNGYTAAGTSSFKETPATCKDKCNKDKKCRGAAFDYSSQECKLVSEDPFVISTPAASGTWSMFVRRPVGQGPSKWGAWVPEKCPPCGDKNETVQKRTCDGVRCLGEATHDCKIDACFDRFDGLSINPK